MKHKAEMIKFIAVLAAVVIFSVGCGSFVDLSEDESKQIVNYSTNVLNDHNSAIKGSLKELTKTDLKDIVIKDDPSIIQEIEEAKEEATREIEEAQSPKEQKDSAGESEAGEEEESGPMEVQDADIAELIGLQGFSVEYSGHGILDSYPDPSDPESDMLFSIEPAAKDDKLLVLYFNVMNTGEEEAVCNILSLQPRFRFKTGGKTHSFLTTLLLDDLSTLEVTLQSGESKRAVLVAELSSEKLAGLSDLTLIIMGGEENTEILLEKEAGGGTEAPAPEEAGDETEAPAPEEKNN